MALTPVLDFAGGTARNVRLLDGGVLARGGGEQCGDWTSPVYTAESPFTWAVASWNTDGAGAVVVELRVQSQGGWSPWFSFGAWSAAGDRHSLAGQKVEGVGRMDTDTLRLDQPARQWQMRVQIAHGTLKRLWLTTALPGTPTVEGEPPREAWGKDLSVPLRSQMVYPNGGNVWCSPTSLSMVMAFWGHEESIPEQCVPGVFDPVYEGHGNWPFNTAYAATRGFVAYVDRFSSYADLERWIDRGIPVICSVAYSRDWLENAPLAQVRGHLLVVRGFTEQGDVIVNDPAAAEDTGVRLVYKRDQFRRAWLERAGVVYVIYPE